MASKLLSILATSLGPTQARLELKWMQQQARHPAQLTEMVTRRSRGEPLQYILGSQPFGPLNLLTRPPVLIPRPETEHWVIKLADRTSASPTSPKSLLDLGTGSGCIPLLLCHLLPQGSLRTHGVDISPQALDLAKENAAVCGIPPSSPGSCARNTRNTFTATLGNFLDPMFSEDATIDPPYDIITCNPPYIPWHEYLKLPRSVTAYEDPKALFGGPTGLDFYHAIAHLVRQTNFIRPGAVVALEVGHNQAQDVERIMRVHAHVRDTEIWPDPWGKQRTVLAHL
ncbi:putative methyltransferase [Lyophyllum shimeji]|uniref:Methyltransferase n=1 Tax=Lyophyllum shimeji TaxID=47721 RepID=A0A9P3PLQ1_LYOSH|nr:putative methyltransferase [Lyophyllum shimeji]